VELGGTSPAPASHYVFDTGALLGTYTDGVD
jgi:hypothetical protein